MSHITRMNETWIQLGGCSTAFPIQLREMEDNEMFTTSCNVSWMTDSGSTCRYKHLTDDDHLVADSGRCRLLRSPDDKTIHVSSHEHTTPSATEVRCCWSAADVEQSIRLVLRHFISYEQVEWQLKTVMFVINWPRCIVTECLFAH